jgi:PIN domain nuclease of toxin-antitoxin system
MIVVDTHAWLWWASDPSSLGRAAARELRSAKRIGVSAISCFEVATAIAKGRVVLDRGPLEWIEQALDLPGVELLPISPAVAVKATQLGHEFHGDPADRIIVATALLEDARLATKDQRIQAYPALETIW